MKKIMWVSNVPVDSVAIDCGQKVSGGGGWVQGLYEAMKDDKSISLTICFPSNNDKKYIGETEGVKYFSFFQKQNIVGISDPLAINKRTIEDIRFILDTVKPDILHVFGTEFSHSLLFLKQFNRPDRAIIHIQGLASAYYPYYYFADLPYLYRHFFVPSSIFRGTIASQQKIMRMRGKNEIQALKLAGYILGRTEWDKACTQKITKAEYRVCNEILRSPFYSEDKEWVYDECEKHTLFASQSSYPLKGLHYILLALPSIINEFPDTKLYVAGTDPIKDESLKGFLTRSPYGFYLKSIIKRYNLKNNIIFTGSLSAEEMKAYYLKANAFVLSSTVENSPNSLGEAMILGTPCISSSVGGVSSMLTHEKEGLTYQYNEVHMLSHYICKVFKNPSLAKEIGAAARKRAYLAHNREAIGNMVKDLYDEIINR